MHLKEKLEKYPSIHALLIALSNYRQRKLTTSAASVSFYALFSFFPLLAFLTYVVGVISDGSRDFSPTKNSASMVLRILQDYIPAIQGWIESGLFEILQGHRSLNWINFLALFWSARGLFLALSMALSHLPEEKSDKKPAWHLVFFNALFTFFFFSIMTATVVGSELIAIQAKRPTWFEYLPFEVQDILYLASQSGMLLVLVNSLCVGSIYRLLVPTKMKFRHAFAGALVFSALMLCSRSIYLTYMEHHKNVAQTTFGIFSTLILNLLWLHFNVNSLLYGCLYALTLKAGFPSNRSAQLVTKRAA